MTAARWPNTLSRRASLTTVELKSYAKVNIGLRILGRRSDGFHDIDTYFHLIALHDYIALSFEEADRTVVTISGNEAYIPPGGMDLMEKAARLFSFMTGIRFHVDISIIKRIPVKAGLGGGSGNASCILKALNSICGDPLSCDGLMKASLCLGSDVPFFTSGLVAAHGMGRGEILEEIEAVDLPLVLVHRPGEAVSTKEAFMKADEGDVGSLPLPPWTRDASKWQDLYPNDFDFIQPILSDEGYLECASQALYHSTSGSGSSQLLVARDGRDAERLCGLLGRRFGDLEMVSTEFAKNIH